MKIVEISGPDSSIKYPILQDGGRERVIEWISNELGKTQNVIVVAQDGSFIDHCDIINVPHSNGLDPSDFYQAFLQRDLLLECDILHVHHPKYLLFSECIRAKKIVLTHHGFYPDMANVRKKYSFFETYVSQYLRSIMDEDEVGFTVYNPIPAKEYPLLNCEKSNDLLFIGDCNKKVKRLDIALDVAQELNVQLIVAGRANNDLLNQFAKMSFVTYIGEIDQKTKMDLMSRSKAVICPNDPPEAFCLVAAEACAVGTPVLASNNGGLPEVIKHGLNGFICNNMEDYLEYYGKICCLESQTIRSTIISSFDVGKISHDYYELFRLLLMQ